MPIYEYRCSACGVEREFLQKMSDPPATRCPACGQETLVKKVSAAGFQLKGSGWYVTDFRNGSKPAASTGTGTAAKAAGDGAAKEGGKDGGAEAAKPAATETPAPAGGSKESST